MWVSPIIRYDTYSNILETSRDRVGCMIHALHLRKRSAAFCAAFLSFVPKWICVVDVIGDATLPEGPRDNLVKYVGVGHPILREDSVWMLMTSSRQQHRPPRRSAASCGPCRSHLPMFPSKDPAASFFAGKSRALDFRYLHTVELFVL